MQAFLPQGLSALSSIVRNWTFSLFYLMSELWGSVVVSVLVRSGEDGRGSGKSLMKNFLRLPLSVDQDGCLHVVVLLYHSFWWHLRLGRAREGGAIFHFGRSLSVPPFSLVGGGRNGGNLRAHRANEHHGRLKTTARVFL